MAADPHTPILVVDDYREMARLIRTLLKNLGFDNIEEVTTGGDALAKLYEKPFGLVISDWNMQPMSGLHLLKAIRADSRLRALPVIMVSGHGDPETVATAKAAGVSSFIVKPFTTTTLRDQIAAALDGR